MCICRLWCDFEEILMISIFFYEGKRGEVVGGVGGAGGGGGEAPLPPRKPKPSVLHIVRIYIDGYTYVLVYVSDYGHDTKIIGTSHTRSSIVFTVHEKNTWVLPEATYSILWSLTRRIEENGLCECVKTAQFPPRIEHGPPHIST